MIWLDEKKVTAVKNYSTPNQVKFVITENKNGIKCNNVTLKLKTYIHTSNMVLFTKDSKLKKYENTKDIINTFCNVRFDFYKLRKKYLLSELKNQIKILTNKAKFLEEVMSEKLKIFKIEEDQIILQLEKKGYEKVGEQEKTYNYLLNMNIRSFSKNKLVKLLDDIENIKNELIRLEGITEKQMWLNDIKEFLKEYKKFV